MLEGCVFWPAEFAARYRARGWWEGVTITQMLARSAERSPGKTALVCAGQRLSYRDLVQTSDRLACRFLEAGIEPLDRVVVQLPNGPEFVHTYFALTRIGAIPVMALRAHRHTEIRHFVRASSAIAYVIPDRIGSFDYRTMAAEVQKDFPSLHTVFVSGEPATGQRDLREMITEPISAEAIGSALATLRPDPSEVATMLLSGGTTSLSKLIPRTHDDYVLNARLFVDEETSPKETIDRFRKLILKDKVDCVQGIISTGVSLGVAPIAEEERKLLMLWDGTTQDGVKEVMPNARYTLKSTDDECEATMASLLTIRYFKGRLRRIAGVSPDYSYYSDGCRQGLCPRTRENHFLRLFA